MTNPTVRISQKAHRTLKQLAARSGELMQDILDEAIEQEYRRRFVEEANLSYTRVRENPNEWMALQAERDEWDATLVDGLEATDQSAKVDKQSQKNKKGRARGD